jgi:CRP-like cAMP-binding protein
MFLLGGDPRASVIVKSETAEVLQLPRDRLRELLNNQVVAVPVFAKAVGLKNEKIQVFAAKFWKYLCAVTSSRMNATQARFDSPPHVPAPCNFKVPTEEEVKAKSMGSIPALPELPSSARRSERRVDHANQAERRILSRNRRACTSRGEKAAIKKIRVFHPCNKE